MRYQPFGKTGLFVSELCLGAMTFGGNGIYRAIGEVGSAEAESLLGTSFDAGVNFIDTADVYSDGESERLVGAALRALARPREQVVVATKVRGRVGPGVNQVGLSRGHILASIDGSLKRPGLLLDRRTRHRARDRPPLPGGRGSDPSARRGRSSSSTTSLVST
jgi:aryl-alcohol dehydrogenase-like predicted oxidoreductase